MKLLHASVSEKAIRSYQAKAQQQAQLDIEELVANISVLGGVISLVMGKRVLSRETSTG